MASSVKPVGGRKFFDLGSQRALVQCDESIGRKVRVNLDTAEGPADFDVNRCGGAETKVETRIVCGDVARLAHGFLDMNFAAAANGDSASEGAAIAFGSVQADLDPVVVGRSVIAQERGRLILIHDENVEVAVIVEVAECATAADVAGVEGGLGLFGDLYECSVTEIAK